MRAIVIANPTAGSYTHNKHQIEESIAVLRKHSWQVKLQFTQTAGDAQRLAQIAADQGLDAVIVVGGDGTINEVIQALAGSETALGVLPNGTVNVWARETGIPLDTAEACNVLLNGQLKRIDLGQVNDRYFLLMAGVGIDGEVTHAVERKPVKRFGVLGYLLYATWYGIGYRSFNVILQMDARVVRTTALQIIIGNTQLYAGAIKYTWQAKCDDGLLDICAVRKRNILGRVIVMLDFFFKRKQRKQWVRYERCKSIKIHTRQPVAMQIDGEPAGHTSIGFPPITFSAIPGALKVIVPQHLPEGLFSSDTT